MRMWLGRGRGLRVAVGADAGVLVVVRAVDVGAVVEGAVAAADGAAAALVGKVPAGGGRWMGGMRKWRGEEGKGMPVEAGVGAVLLALVLLEERTRLYAELLEVPGTRQL